MQLPQHHHHKPKPSVSSCSSWIRRSPLPLPPHKKTWCAGARGRSWYACHLVPLLVLTVYSVFTVLRTPSSSLVITTIDSDSITAADVGLTRNMSYFRRVDSCGTPIITYLHLYECEAFSIGIFCLPSRGVIPLHNHPGMTVFSKLLFGAMYVKSYDWADVPQHTTDVQLQRHHLAKVKADGILTAPCETSVLYPEDGGNMHCFTAQSACAVLDVLGPPYDDGSGRHCQHYNVSSSAPSVGDSMSFSGGDGYAWLEESEPPEDFYLVGSTYMGPRILDH